MLWCHVPTLTFPSPQSQLGRCYLFLRHFLLNLNLFMLLYIVLQSSLWPRCLYISGQPPPHSWFHGVFVTHVSIVSFIFIFKVRSLDDSCQLGLAPVDCGPHSVTPRWCWSFSVNLGLSLQIEEPFFYGQCFLIRLSVSSPGAGMFLLLFFPSQISAGKVKIPSKISFWIKWISSVAGPIVPL